MTEIVKVLQERHRLFPYSASFGLRRRSELVRSSRMTSLRIGS